MPHVYVLGAVKPWVKTAAQEVGDKFDISTIYGVGARAEASDHPGGLATDFMVYTDRAKGDAVAAYVKANWTRLDVKYIIWYQRIDEGSGWTPMADRGGTTANHKDHVHVSYMSAAGGAKEYAGNATDTTGSASDSGTSTGSSLAPLTSAGTWLRVLEFIAGLALIGFLLREVINNATS